jgi:hypothetical protein
LQTGERPASARPALENSHGGAPAGLATVRRVSTGFGSGKKTEGKADKAFDILKRPQSGRFGKQSLTKQGEDLLNDLANDLADTGGSTPS